MIRKFLQNSSIGFRALMVVALLSATSAQAALLAYEDFSYGTGLLNGDNGGTGWGGSWAAAAGASIVDPAIDLSGNRALAITGNNNNMAYRSLASAYSGSEVFVSMQMQLSSGTLNSNDFAALWFDTAASGAHNNRPQIGIKGDISGSNDIFARTNGGSGSFAAGSSISAGQSFTVLGRLWKSTGTGNYDRLSLWFNPVANDLATPDAVFSGSAGLSSISMLGFRSANLDSGDTVLVDALRVGTTWADAMPVPEPAPLTLASCGLFVVLIARRLACRHAA